MAEFHAVLYILYCLWPFPYLDTVFNRYYKLSRLISLKTATQLKEANLRNDGPQNCTSISFFRVYSGNSSSSLIVVMRKEHLETIHALSYGKGIATEHKTD